MANSSFSERWPDAIARALLLIPEHPQVSRIGVPRWTSNGSVEVDVTFTVNLPHVWYAAGQSPNGVRSLEDVRFLFPSSFPIDAPVPTLRPDFDRSHPHILPHLQDGRPIPCITDLSINSLLHQHGFRGILNQTALWLANAALGTLIDPVQGWEPARRDDLPHGITADADLLRAQVNREGGHLYFPFDYAILELSRGGKGLRGVVENTALKFYKNTIGNHLSISPIGMLTRGRSLTLFVWPGKNTDGTPLICSEYRPDDVNTFGALLARSTQYGLHSTLSEQFAWLRRCVQGTTLHSDLRIGIILGVRRPCHLIGTESNIELICYVASFHDLAATSWEDKPVEPAAHNEQLGVALCQRLSGVGNIDGTWTLIGAGSLGSKIAMHLTRQGMAPSHVIDKGEMRAHNAVRHALSPPPAYLQALFAGNKARMLCEVIAGFSQHAEEIRDDAANLIRRPAGRRRIVSKQTIALVNSAASIRVREAIASLPPDEMEVSVIETSLYSEGRVGLITVENFGRSSNTGDLITEFYRIGAATQPLRELLYGDGKDLSRVRIGDGCGSPTMVISDSKLSAHGAAMAQILTDELRCRARPHGRISIGVTGEDGVSLAWTHHTAPTVRVLKVNNNPQWSVRLSESVEVLLADEISRWPGVETGGILMGRISEISRTFYVVDVLPAPPDSTRSAALFTLGVQGVNAALEEYSDRHGWTLYCLGTWHNHLGASTPSTTDKLTTRGVALARVAPSLLLIKAPAGYSALVADSAKFALPK